MSWLPLSFGVPAVLWGLLALPVIWWLLRLTPPKPLVEIFPPLKILARVAKREETPSKSPWWLTLLRLAMAALIVFAIADPVLNPRERLPANGNLLAIVMDNGWSSASDWQMRVATAQRLINDAEANETPIMLAFTAEKPNQEIGPFTAGEARDRLAAMKPRPLPTNRPDTMARVGDELAKHPGASIAMLTDGLAGENDPDSFAKLLEQKPANLVWVQPDSLPMLAMTAANNEIDRFSITVARAVGTIAPRIVTAGALDNKGRRIGDATITFGPGETSGTGEIVVPFELRNDFASIVLDGERHAAGIRVLDNTDKRRRVGLLSQSPLDDSRLLLSPTYYLRRALEPFADIVEPQNPEIGQAMTEVLNQKPAIIVMADVGVVPEAVRPALLKWLRDGGTLVRFASSTLLQAGNDADLLPVTLRAGERQLGGALSWTEPQPVTEFPPTGPFADLTPPSEVTVSRQILAEPTPDLIDHTWATLADGTPLVTGDRRGKGIVVLFHVTPQATWSNLPISGTFVEMMRRIVQLSRNQGAVATGESSAESARLAPFRLISADGQLVPPDGEARPLETGKKIAPVSIDNPPGLYGTEEGLVAHNLLDADAKLTPIVRPQVSVPMLTERYAEDQSTDLKGPLLLAALLFFLIDGLIVLWMAGRLRWQNARPAANAAAMILACVVAFAPDVSHAQDSKPDDATAIDAVSVTHLAYVITGDNSVDNISKAGLTGLSQFLIEKTALEPGEPRGVDLNRDELAFYPLIYWPIDANAQMPSQEAIARIDAYMKEGGTVLFDTRDQFSSPMDGSTSPATQRLRDILVNLNVPPLEPVPEDHVLSKAFFILKSFPGRYDGSPLWVEASLDASNPDNAPVRTGDGVSPILITGNDFAGAWAVDDSGASMLPTIPGDPMQRIYAYRAGVNIVMYMLTGNYKSDQVHVPALLERLGQ
ncbi:MULTISPECIES: DUF4159 domain-containing protein [Mesorhizobium]|uniref:DUF4159 domain-containing protein n=1 Tax=Mesorhizobium denitrificans TaxID=2294114 RepID=A0A371XE61_9HYPH|nr:MULTISPECIES: DUF4159 domain-containing protein [Mesorhizobium]RFC67473.1 DUF4159 domain-containing protein [Mesorhizobium denitrificans]